jgi:hypothetical protein
MAPEQCTRGVVNRRTDIYSLGMTFADLFGVGRGQRHSAELGSECPPTLVKLIERMTCQEPAGPGLFGSGHERSVRARFAAARPSARLGR